MTSAPWAEAGVATGLLSLVLALFLLARIGDRLLVRLEFSGSRGERWVARFAVAVGVAVAVVTALGVAGRLRWAFFWIVVALLALALEWPRKGGAPTPPAITDRPSDWRTLLPSTAAIAVVAGRLTEHAFAWRYRPPGGAHYDDVSYHLPAAAIWLQHGDLRMLRFDFGDPSTPFYPIGGEIVSWLLMAPLRSDVLARWSQLPAALAILALLWILCRRAGGSAWAASGAVALAVTVERFAPDGALSAGNDLWAACWLLACVFFLDRYARRPSLGEAILLGLALGGFLGVKYFSLLCLPALGIAAAVVATRRASGPARPRWRHAAAMAAVAFVVGGFTYMRNAIVTGNPLFPQPVEVAGRTLLPGWPETALDLRVEQAAGGSPFGAFGDRPELLGPVWGVLFLWSLPLLPLLGLVVARRSGDPPARLLVALTLLPGLLVVTYALFAPDLRDVRYVIAAPLAAGAALAALLSRAPSRLAAAVWLGLLALLAVRGGGGAATLPVRAWLAPLAAGGIAFLWSRLGSRTRRVAAVVAPILVALALLPKLEKYQRLRQRSEAGARALEELAAGRAVTVAYFGGNRPHFYFGNRFANRLEIVPFGGDVERRFYDFGRPPEWDSFRGNRARSWLANLDRLGVEFVVSGEDGGAARQARWLGRSESPFELAAEGPGYRIWRRGVGSPERRAPDLAR